MDNRQAYAEAGVNVEEGYKAVELMKEHVRSTFSDRVIGDLGSLADCSDWDLMRTLSSFQEQMAWEPN